MSKTITLQPGKYIAAVSGGVDSVVLLDMLSKLPELEIIVAHFDHGIRESSVSDRIFVQQLATHYNLAFIYDEGKLGARASEAVAREARYKFLYQALDQEGAQVVLTAHHQDDMLETAVINLLRGTGRKGLTALGSSVRLQRPLLHFTKQDLRDYATLHHLEWHEDSTNSDTSYLRNYVRRSLLSSLSPKQRQEFMRLLDNTTVLNRQLDTLLADQLAIHQNADGLDRSWFILLPHNVAKEVIATWLREHKLREFDRKTVDRLVISAKTMPTGRRIEVYNGVFLVINKYVLALTTTDR